MVYSQTNLVYAEQVSSSSKAYRNFLRPLHNNTTKLDYIYWFRTFMRWANSSNFVAREDDFETLMKMNPDEITDLLLDWIDFEKSKGNKGTTIASKICAPETFLEMNRKIWHSKLVRRSIPRDESEPAGKLPIKDSEIRTMLSLTSDLRTIALIHFLASTGIRPYALEDPILRLKHLSKVEFGDGYCYSVKVYDESKDGYWAFLTPEATQALDGYLRSRPSCDLESPVFPTKTARLKTINHIRAVTARGILRPLVKKAVIRKKVGKNRYDKAIVYMFRKRFNGKLKLENSVNSNIAEKLMAHKKGLDGTYLQPTKEECFNEFVKAIPELTINNFEKKQAELDQSNKEKKVLEKKNRELMNMKDELEKIKKRLRISETFDKF
jgi:integrase/recombinase XerD